MCRSVSQSSIDCFACSLQGQRSAPNAVWPHPQQIALSNDSIFLRPHDLEIFSNIQTCDIISKAIDRYDPLLFPPKLNLRQPPSDDVSILQSLTLNIREDPQCETYIQQTSDESCQFTLSLLSLFIRLPDSQTHWPSIERSPSSLRTACGVCCVVSRHSRNWSTSMIRTMYVVSPSSSASCLKDRCNRWWSIISSTSRTVLAFRIEEWCWTRLGTSCRCRSSRRIWWVDWQWVYIYICVCTSVSVGCDVVQQAECVSLASGGRSVVSIREQDVSESVSRSKVHEREEKVGMSGLCRERSRPIMCTRR